MKRLDNYWYSVNPVSILLTPLSWLFRIISALRRFCYRRGLLTIYTLNVPVIVIGNISVGGTGKTPLVIWLVKQLQQAGYKPGIVSRGYRGKAQHWPQSVNANSDPIMVGDETVLLATHAACPVVVAPDRVAAAKMLLNKHNCNIIVSDDGLQHYALHRDIEIIVIDGERRFGNTQCLPAGPLREPISRLNKSDIIIVNGGQTFSGEHSMKLIPQQIVNLVDQSQQWPNSGPANKTIHAVVGIGNPQRFFITLKEMGFNLIEHVFPDHHAYNVNDIVFDDELPVIMTEKDAVKCRSFAKINHWFLPVTAEINDAVSKQVLKMLS